MVDLSDYYSEGYHLICAGKPDWEQLQTDLLPTKLVSVSDHMSPHLQVFWGWNPGNRKAAVDFGIPQERLDEFVHWCGYKHDIVFDAISGFTSTDAARGFIQRFLPDTTDLFLIGVGLVNELAEKQIADSLAEGQTTSLQRHELLEPGGEVLGFDVGSIDHNDFGCSWLCSYLHNDMYDLFGIRTNQYGLLTETDARKVYEWIAEDAMRGQRAEPILYSYWLLMSYPLVDENREN